MVDETSAHSERANNGKVTPKSWAASHEAFVCALAGSAQPDDAGGILEGALELAVAEAEALVELVGCQHVLPHALLGRLKALDLFLLQCRVEWNDGANREAHEAAE